MARSDHPAKELARIALSGERDAKMLEQALAFCWDQLGYLRTSGEMDDLRATLSLADDPDDELLKAARPLARYIEGWADLHDGDLVSVRVDALRALAAAVARASA